MNKINRYSQIVFDACCIILYGLIMGVIILSGAIFLLFVRMGVGFIDMFSSLVKFIFRGTIARWFKETCHMCKKWYLDRLMSRIAKRYLPGEMIVNGITRSNANDVLDKTDNFFEELIIYSWKSVNR